MELEEKAFSYEIKEIKENGYFEGYASTFGNVDHGRDVVVKGAFEKTLMTRPVAKILWQHMSYYPIGKSIDMHEDDKGLFVSGQLTMQVEKAKDAYHLMRDKVIDGLSIGYESIVDEVKDNIRYLKEVVLYEFSPVTFQMNELAGVTGVKSDDMILNKLKSANNVREVEGILREAGLPIAMSKVIASRFESDRMREAAALTSLLEGIKKI